MLDIPEPRHLVAADRDTHVLQRRAMHEHQRLDRTPVIRQRPRAGALERLPQRPALHVPHAQGAVVGRGHEV